MDSKKLTTCYIKPAGCQQGVSLIELMIGMVIGLVLLGGILQTMLASKEAAATRQSISTITDNARFLFDFMARDLRMGGRKFDPDNNSEWLDGWPDNDPPIEIDDNGTLIVRYLDADNVAIQVEYSYDEDEDQIEYRRGEDGVFGNLEPLIGGVENLEFAFALGTDPDVYSAVNSSDWPNVTAVQTTVVFIDEAPWGGQDQAIGEKRISSTVALRNQVSRLITP